MSPRSRTSWPSLVVLAAAALFGTTGTAQELGPGGVSPLALGAVRVLIGAAGLVMLAVIRGASLHECRAQLAPIVVAGVGVAGYQLGFFEGTARAGVALGTLVALGSGPVFAGLFDAIHLGRPPSGRWLGATALAVAGAGLVAFARGDASGSRVVSGVACALAAGLAYAVFSIASKRAMSAGLASVTVMACSFTIGAALLAPLLLVESVSWLGTARGAAVALHLGLAATTLAYALFGAGLSRLAVPTVVTLTLFEPATAAVLSVVVLDQSLAAVGWLGVALVMAGVALIARAPPEPMAE